MPESQSKKVLLVEDENFLSSLIRTRLEKEGFEVNQAFDGEEAMTWLSANHPNLIILDLILPKMSGFEVLEQIAYDPEKAQIPVIILSNLAQDSDIVKAKNLGAKEYFVKVRISTDEIIDRVKSLIPQ